MTHKLFLYVSRDDVEVRREKTKIWTQAAEKPIGRKVPVEWPKDDILKYESLGQEHGNRDEHNSDC